MYAETCAFHPLCDRYRLSLGFRPRRAYRCARMYAQPNYSMVRCPLFVLCSLVDSLSKLHISWPVLSIIHMSVRIVLPTTAADQLQSVYAFVLFVLLEIYGDFRHGSSRTCHRVCRMMTCIALPLSAPSGRVTNEFRLRGPPTHWKQYLGESMTRYILSLLFLCFVQQIFSF